ncbi:hypothetical protein K3172_03790 [Qipengyuania sp. 6B39]|uniref:hypothetical protein n=1 Tax=Qipengyuania proteolytica TaxID=2867239 RepID=UPI001C89A18B|nr:hypothetical protein [Qipengyuania proteolytica]MBX7494977.1 hypothetical protein [Qipengyuania proteolytica]
MSSLPEAGKRSRQPVRVAVIAAAMAVVGCFTAAFTFADQPARAAQVEQRR